MAVALPALPNLAQIQPQLLDFSGRLTPALGGPVQQISRLGSRFSVQVTLPPLAATEAAAWIAARLKAKTENETLTLEWPQAGPRPAVGGAPYIAGSGQAGARLNAGGFTAGAVIPANSFFSFGNGDRYFLHTTTAEATADGSGNVQLHIAPILRSSPPDENWLAFNPPIIEGFIDGSSVDWTLDRLLWTTTSFTLTENE